MSKKNKPIRLQNIHYKKSAKKWIENFVPPGINPYPRKKDSWYYYKYCCIKANWKDTEVLIHEKKIIIKRGSFVTSKIESLAEAGLSRDEIRSAFSRLEQANLITRKVMRGKKGTTNKHIITVVHYDQVKL